jgi:hypothetical protein
MRESVGRWKFGSWKVSAAAGSGYFAPVHAPLVSNDPMRSALTAAFTSLVLIALAGCVPERAGSPAHPNVIIVREFAASAAIVTLDPSFGFSLYRGTAGVPPKQRAAGVARAAAFSLADVITTQLTALGYDAVRSDTAAPEPGARALIVSGAFRHIDEGRRRRVGAENPSIAVDVEIEFQADTAPPQRITELHFDSQRVPRDAVVGASARGGVDVNLAATRVGGAIARYVGETARLNSWPAAAR